MRKLIVLASLLMVFSVAANAGVKYTDWVSSLTGGHQYRIGYADTGFITWEEANNLSGGGIYLATVTSKDENSFIFDNLAKTSSYWNGQMGPWLGGYATKDTAGVWQWSWVPAADTQEAWGYTNWGTGQPNYIPPSGQPKYYLHFWNGGSGDPKAFWADTGYYNTGTYQVKSFVQERVVPEPATLLGFGLPMLMVGLGKLRGLRK